MFGEIGFLFFFLGIFCIGFVFCIKVGEFVVKYELEVDVFGINSFFNFWLFFCGGLIGFFGVGVWFGWFSLGFFISVRIVGVGVWRIYFFIFFIFLDFILFGKFDLLILDVDFDGIFGW